MLPRRGGKKAERSRGRTQKSVLITGATDGLGRAAALLLAQRGYRVFAAGRSTEKRAQLDALAREKQLPSRLWNWTFAMTLRSGKRCGAVLAKADAIDFLINNAGVNFTAAVEDLRLEDWRRQFETNFFGVLRVTQAVVPHMRERRRGRILMMSSVSGFVTAPTQGAYSSSKFALEAYEQRAAPRVVSLRRAGDPHRAGLHRDRASSKPPWNSPSRTSTE